MSVKMQPISFIKTRLGLDKDGSVQRFFQDKCYQYMDKYVPYREGRLRQQVDMSNPERIVYEMPYARYQYYGKLMVMDNGKGAYYSPTYGFWSDKGKKKHLTDRDLVYHPEGTKRGSYWDKKMVSAEMSDLIKDIQKFINRGGK